MTDAGCRLPAGAGAGLAPAGWRAAGLAGAGKAGRVAPGWRAGLVRISSNKQGGWDGVRWLLVCWLVVFVVTEKFL